MIVINPGTEPITGASRKNALKAAEYFMEDLGYKGFSFKLIEEHGNEQGWFDFKFKKNDFSLTVSFPGSDPEITRLGKPWESPRIYVEGSSWLWGYGLDIFGSRFTDYLIEREK